MAYVKNTWVDQEGQVRYTETEDGGYKIFTPNFEEVTEIGTPVNADNMNHIEDGIADCYDYVDTQITAMLSTIYPVGSIYISTSETNPLEAMFGTWVLVSEGRVLQGSDENHEAGTTIPAGLPNLYGSFALDNKHWLDGYLIKSVGSNHSGATGDDGLEYNVEFNALNYNSIYGNSDTVQPPAYVVNIWRRTA